MKDELKVDVLVTDFEDEPCPSYCHGTTSGDAIGVASDDLLGQALPCDSVQFEKVEQCVIDAVPCGSSTDVVAFAAHSSG